MGSLPRRESSVRTRKPDDLVFNGAISDLSVGGFDEYVEGAIDSWGGSRAAQQRRYASEMGLAFNQVSCTVAYIHRLTRQEAWEAYGQDRWADEHFEANGYKWASEREWGGTFRHFLTKDGVEVPEPDWPEPPAVVPDDWEPRESDYVYRFVNRDHPAAEKVVVCEQR